MENVARHRVGSAQIGPSDSPSASASTIAGPPKRSRQQQIQERLESAQTRGDRLKAKVVEYSEEFVVDPKPRHTVSSAALHVSRQAASGVSYGGMFGMITGPIAHKYQWLPSPARVLGLDQRNGMHNDAAGAAVGAAVGTVKGVVDVARGPSKKEIGLKRLDHLFDVTRKLSREFPEIPEVIISHILEGYTERVAQKKRTDSYIRENLERLENIAKDGNKYVRHVTGKIREFATLLQKETTGEQVHTKAEDIQALIEWYGKGYRVNQADELSEGKIRLKPGQYTELHTLVAELREKALEFEHIPAPLDD